MINYMIAVATIAIIVGGIKLTAQTNDGVYLFLAVIFGWIGAIMTFSIGAVPDSVQWHIGTAIMGLGMIIGFCLLVAAICKGPTGGM